MLLIMQEKRKYLVNVYIPMLLAPMMRCSLGLRTIWIAADGKKPYLKLLDSNAGKEDVSKLSQRWLKKTE